MIKYDHPDDTVLYDFSYHLERRRKDQLVGTVVLTLQLSGDQQRGADVSVLELEVNQPQRRQALNEVTRFSLAEDSVTFYQAGSSVLISSNGLVRWNL